MKPLNGLTQITSGQIQKGDIIKRTHFGNATLYNVVKTSKINAFVKELESKNDLAWEVQYNREISKLRTNSDTTEVVFRKIA